MIEQRFKEMVANLIKDGQVIKDELTPEQAHTWHMATGLAGEAGEVLDCIKKHVVYQKNIDMDNLLEELGDCEFFLEGLRETYGITREQVLDGNIKKLSKRYHKGKYSNEQARERADKKDVTEKEN